MTETEPRTSRSARWVRIAVPAVGLFVIVAIVVGLWIRGDDDEPSATPDQYAAAYLAVCEAAALAADDTNAAYNTFFDDAHTVLHALAADASTSARPETAAMLEAKNRVETSLATSSTTTATDLDDLAAATRTTIVAIDEPDPGACP